MKHHVAYCRLTMVTANLHYALTCSLFLFFSLNPRDLFESSHYLLSLDVYTVKGDYHILFRKKNGGMRHCVKRVMGNVH